MNPISISLPKKKIRPPCLHFIPSFGRLEDGMKGALSSIAISYYHNFSLRVLYLLNMLLSPPEKWKKNAIFACYYFCLPLLRSLYGAKLLATIVENSQNFSRFLLLFM